jgi:hypothetical protein
MAPSRVDIEIPNDGLVTKRIATKVAPTTNVKSISLGGPDKTDLVLRVFRCLVADLCEQFKGGHPGYVQSENGTGVSYSNIVKRRHGHGGDWGLAVEVCYEVFSQQPLIFQPR